MEPPVGDVPQVLAPIIKHIRDAHEDLIAGRYDGAVGRVRLALEGRVLSVSDDSLAPALSQD